MLYQFECKYSTLYVNVMRFTDVTCYFLQVKSENLYISYVRKIILHVVSMWDMEIPPTEASALTPNSDPRVEFPYPTSIQMNDSLNISACVSFKKQSSYQAISFFIAFLEQNKNNTLRLIDRSVCDKSRTIRRILTKLH
jgi:hypothetical protein